MNLIFECNKETIWGEEVYISGNIEELGNWDIDKAIKLDSINYPLWSVNVSIECTQDEIEYKFFIKTSDNEIKWNRGRNRTIKLNKAEEQMGKYTKKFRKKNEKSISHNKKKRSKKKVFHEVVVLATMSSGKSTIINSLLGEEILPNENQACTAKIFKVIDDDDIEKNRLTVKYKDDTTSLISADNLYELNNNSNVKEIIIEGDFKGVKNKETANEIHQICLVDTPGPNNSLDSSHKEIAFELLENESMSHLIYVLNATQLGVNDDKKLLLDIYENQNNKNNKLNIIFVLNKADEVLRKEESLEPILKNAKKYLNSTGFKDCKIIPISAYAAKLFKFALESNLKTRKEKSDFLEYFELFEQDRISCLEFSGENDYGNEVIEVRGREIYKNDILQRIYATGFIDLENELESVLRDKVLKNKD